MSRKPCLYDQVTLQDGSEGIIKFIGSLSGKDDLYYGVDLTVLGKHKYNNMNGSMRDIEYFKTSNGKNGRLCKPKSLKYYKLTGDSIQLTYGNKIYIENAYCDGIIKYIGTPPDQSTEYIGVILEEDNGDTDGTYKPNGAQYFQCQQNYGMYIPLPSMESIQSAKGNAKQNDDKKIEDKPKPSYAQNAEVKMDKDGNKTYTTGTEKNKIVTTVLKVNSGIDSGGSGGSVKDRMSLWNKKSDNDKTYKLKADKEKEIRTSQKLYDKAMVLKMQKEQAENDKKEEEKRDKIRREQEKKAEQIKKDKLERQKLRKEENEKRKREEQQKQILEKEALEKEKRERETAQKAKKEKLEKEKREREAAERARKEQEQKRKREMAEKARKEKLEREAAEQARKEKLQKERLEKEAADNAKKEKLQKQKLEREAAERARKERLERERQKKEAAEKARKEEEERKKRERMEKERLRKEGIAKREKERREKEAKEKREKLEKGKIEKEEKNRKLKELEIEKEKLRKEKLEKERIESERRENEEKERKEREKKERIKRQKEAFERKEKETKEREEREKKQKLEKEQRLKASRERAEKIRKEKEENAKKERDEKLKIKKEKEKKQREEKLKREQEAKAKAEKEVKAKAEKPKDFPKSTGVYSGSIQHDEEYFDSDDDGKNAAEMRRKQEEEEEAELARQIMARKKRKAEEDKKKAANKSTKTSKKGGKDSELMDMMSQMNDWKNKNNTNTNTNTSQFKRKNKKLEPDLGGKKGRKFSNAPKAKKNYNKKDLENELKQSIGKDINKIKMVKLDKYEGDIPLVLYLLGNEMYKCNKFGTFKLFEPEEMQNKKHNDNMCNLAWNMYLFFSQLPRPLLDSVPQNILMKAINKDVMKDVIHAMDEPFASTLVYLWDILARVAMESNGSKMGQQQLGKVFGPMVTMVTQQDVKGNRVSMNVLAASRMMAMFRRGIEWRMGVAGFNFDDSSDDSD